MTDIVERLRTHDDARLYVLADLLMAEAADEIERNRAAIAELIGLAQKLVDRWDSPRWKDLPHTGEYIAHLRAAITKHSQKEQ